jgi:hypothetical protein
MNPADSKSEADRLVFLWSLLLARPNAEIVHVAASEQDAKELFEAAKRERSAE